MARPYFCCCMKLLSCFVPASALFSLLICCACSVKLNPTSFQASLGEVVFLGADGSFLQMYEAAQRCLLLLLTLLPVLKPRCPIGAVAPWLLPHI